MSADKIRSHEHINAMSVVGVDYLVGFIVYIVAVYVIFLPLTLLSMYQPYPIDE